MIDLSNQPNWKKLFLQMLVGAVIGGASATAVLLLLDNDVLSSPGRLFAVVTGMTYALMGLMVGAGVIAPLAGARFLNVQDVDDLRDQRSILGLSSAACVLVGFLFLVLATVPAGGSDGMVGPKLAGFLAGACLVALIALTSMTNRRVDELTRHISTEASTLAMQANLVLFGGWAGLAHLGLIDWIEPLVFVSGSALLLLLAIFWVSAKRGLMVPTKSAPTPHQ